MNSLTCPSKKKFAVVRLWPGIENAESEIIARLKIAAKSEGLKCVEITAQGISVETGERLTSEDVDFAIHLHFETPKSYDIFSFVALWNPLQFYHDWGYRRYSRNLTTHDDFLSCGSRAADDHIHRMILGDGLHQPPELQLFHSLSDPIIAPKVMQRRIFYVGINWEKINQKKARHHEILKQLDETGKLAIYGPRVFQDVRVWDDFKSYVGEIPFDGVSIINEISNIGAALVFSSEAHRESGLMSNRLFETVAAGAVAICDENPFARAHFGDTVLYVDSRSDTLFEDVSNHLDWLNENPEAAKDMAVAAQEVFKKRYTFDKSLVELYSRLPERRRQLVPIPDPSPEVLVVFVFLDVDENSLTNFRNLSERQDYPNIRIVAVSDAEQVLELPESTPGVLLSHARVNGLANKVEEKLGEVVFDAIRQARPDEQGYLCVMTSNERIYGNHISALVALAEANPECGIASTTAILKNYRLDDRNYFIQDSCQLAHATPECPTGFARFLIRSRLFDDSAAVTVPYLNHRMLAGFARAANIAQSQLASCEVDCSHPFYKVSKLKQYEENQILDDFVKVHSTDLDGYDPRQGSRMLLRMIRDQFIKLPLPPIIRRPLRAVYLWLIRK